ncbi:MAG: ribbon-helix-helix domain-containing protein [Pseudomonadota bacterium]
MSALRPEKRSLTLHGHRTSVTLEAPFWDVFRHIAAEEGVSVNRLASQIDDTRAAGTALATAIRVHVLDWALRGRPPSPDPIGSDPGGPDPAV